MRSMGISLEFRGVLSGERIGLNPSIMWVDSVGNRITSKLGYKQGTQGFHTFGSFYAFGGHLLALEE